MTNSEKQKPSPPPPPRPIPVEPDKTIKHEGDKGTTWQIIKPETTKKR